MRELYYLLVSVLFFSATATIASEITLFDRDGSPVAYIDTSDDYTKFEPYKGFKQYKPYKQYREYEKYQPYLRLSWGKDLEMMLWMGR